MMEMLVLSGTLITGFIWLHGILTEINERIDSIEKDVLLLHQQTILHSDKHESSFVELSKLILSYSNRITKLENKHDRI